MSLAPILMAALAVAAEKVFAGISWLVVTVCNFFVSIFAGLLGMIDIPEIDVVSATPVTLLKILDAIGFWPAIAVIIIGGVVRLILRIVTLGIAVKG